MAAGLDLAAAFCFDRHRSVSSAATLIRGYIGDMITGPLIAEIAALVGEPARATMLSALLDGRALTATELAFAARVTPQTASTHFAKLTEAGLLSPIKDGRHRYFRLASPKVVEMLDGIVAVALENRPRYRPLSRQARELSAARICYDHLAGRLSVDLADFFTTHEYIVLGDEGAEITEAGTQFLSEFGIDLVALSSIRRHFCRLCLDWTDVGLTSPAR
jgi:DNA-binding transcriptional ArsR family regulator